MFFVAERRLTFAEDFNSRGEETKTTPIGSRSISSDLYLESGDSLMRGWNSFVYALFLSRLQPRIELISLRISVHRASHNAFFSQRRSQVEIG